jgi:hypothetical protein
MRRSVVRGQVFFLVTAVVAACSPSEFSAEGGRGAAAGSGGSGGASAGRGGSATGSGGSDEPGSGGSMAGESSVGGGRGVVGGAAGMGAYGGKPPIGSAGTSVGGSGLPASGGSGAESGSGAEPGTGGSDAMGGSAGTGEPGSGGTDPIAGGATGVGGLAGASSTSGGASIGGAMNETGGSAGTTGGSMGQTGGAGGSGATGGTGGGSGGTGGAAMMGGSGGVTPVGGCNNELLVNAGFESGKGVGWTETSDWPGIDLIVNEDEAALAAEGVSPYAGSFLAWLGGIPDNEWDHNVTLIQQYVMIPATASSLTLSGRHLVQSVDDPTAEYDEAYLEFDLDDEVVWQALRLTNQSSSSGWVSFMKTTDLDDLAGKTLLFYAYARTDPTGKTSFFLDSLSLVANCGR